MDEQLVRALVVRVERDEARRVVGRGAVRAGGQPGHGGLVEHGLAAGLQVAALVHQPGVERRARREVHALEEVAPEPGHADPLDPRARQHGPDVDERRRRQLEAQGGAAQRAGVAEQAPDLAEVPAQGAQRVVGVLEEQAGEALAGHGPAVAEQQVGEQRPRLAPARRRHGRAVARHRGRSEEVDGQGRHGPRLPPGRAGVGTGGSTLGTGAGRTGAMLWFRRNTLCGS